MSESVTTVKTGIYKERSPEQRALDLKRTETEKHYDSEYLQHLRAIGKEKPHDVTWSKWVAPLNLNNRHDTLAMLIASGYSYKNAGEQVGYGQSQVTVVMKTPEMQALVKEKKQELIGRPIQQRLERITHPAMDLIEQVFHPDFHDPNMKTLDKIKLATWAIEKITGKAPQVIDNKQSILVQILNRIEEKQTTIPQQQGQVIDVQNTTNSTSTPAEPPPPPVNPIDAWVLDKIPARSFTKESMQDAVVPETQLQSQQVRTQESEFRPEPESPLEPEIDPHSSSLEPAPFDRTLK